MPETQTCGICEQEYIPTAREVEWWKELAEMIDQGCLPCYMPPMCPKCSKELAAEVDARRVERRV